MLYEHTDLTTTICVHYYFCIHIDMCSNKMKYANRSYTSIEFVCAWLTLTEYTLLPITFMADFETNK